MRNITLCCRLYGHMLVMESPRDYFLYFPSVPISSLSNLAEYALLPRRNHVYLGETVQFLLVLRFRKQLDGERSRHGMLRELTDSLSARASACIAEARRQEDPQQREDDEVGDPAGHNGTGSGNQTRGGENGGSPFRKCGVALIDSPEPDRQQNRNEMLPVRKKEKTHYVSNNTMYSVCPIFSIYLQHTCILACKS